MKTELTGSNFLPLCSKHSVDESIGIICGVQENQIIAMFKSLKLHRFLRASGAKLIFVSLQAFEHQYRISYFTGDNIELKKWKKSSYNYYPSLLHFNSVYAAGMMYFLFENKTV